jgi:hypothetical protein
MAGSVGAVGLKRFPAFADEGVVDWEAEDMLAFVVVIVAVNWKDDMCICFCTKIRFVEGGCFGTRAIICDTYVS